MGDERVTKGYWPKVMTGRNNTKNLFFLNGELHRLLQDHRGTNRLLAWNYPQQKRLVYASDQVHAEKQYAFSVKVVCNLLNRSYWHIKELIEHDMIPKPAQAFTVKPDGTRVRGMYVFSEDGVFELWDYFSKVHRGRPRKDGFIRPQALPTRAALRAAMRNQDVMYVKNKDGEFVPVWDKGVY